MGTGAQLLPGAPGGSVIVIMQIFVVLSLAASTFGLPSPQYGGYGDIGAPGYGPGIGLGLGGHGVAHHKDPCEEGTETIMVKKCHLEPDKSCTSEEVVVGSKVVCEDVEKKVPKLTCKKHKPVEHS